MAKIEEPGLIERHIEKIVLVATVAGLVLVLMLWVVHSPRRIDLGPVPGVSGSPGKPGARGVRAGEYPPEQADAQLKIRLDALRAVVAGTEATGTPPPNWPEELAAQFENPYDADAMRGAVPWTTAAAAVTGTETDPVDRQKVTLASLRGAMPAPEAPKVNVAHHVAIVPQIDPRTNASVNGYRETAAMHAAVVFPHGEMLKEWRAILEKPRIPARFIVAAVEVQRQGRAAGGAWGTPTVIRTVRGRQIQLPDVPVFTGTNRDDVRKVVEALGGDQVLKAIIEPEFYDLYDPDRQRASWRPYKPVTRVCRLNTTATVGPGVRPGVYVPGAPYDPMMRRPTILDPAYTNPRGPYVRPPTVSPAAPAPAVARPAVTSTVVPTMRQQLENVAGIVEVWFHDMGLATGTEYRYRVRLRVYNPLLGFTQDAATADAAKVATLDTPWSPWSEAAKVPRLTEFFVMSAFAPPGGDPFVNVEVFTRRWGRVVHDTFKVHMGEAIGGVREHDVMPPGGAGVATKTNISFATGAVVVDFDAKRKIRLPNAPFDTTTTEVVYLDAEGALRTRLSAFDKASPRHAALSDRAKGIRPPGPVDPRLRDPRVRDPRRLDPAMDPMYDPRLRGRRPITPP